MVDPGIWPAEYGVIPEKPPMFPMPPEDINGLFITHSHLDHIGAMPIYYQGSEVEVFATEMTANTTRPMLNDSVKVTALEGYVERFTRDDIEKMYTMMNIAQYGKKIDHR